MGWGVQISTGMMYQMSRGTILRLRPGQAAEAPLFRGCAGGGGGLVSSRQNQNQDKVRGNVKGSAQELSAPYGQHQAQQRRALPGQCRDWSEDAGADREAYGVEGGGLVRRAFEVASPTSRKGREK